MIVVAFFFSITILLSLLLKPLAQKLLLPYSVILILMGFIVSEILVWYGFDTGVRHDNFALISSYVFIPALIFKTAFSIPRRALTANEFGIVALSVPVVIITLFVTAIIIYYGVGHPKGFPWLAAFITAAVLSSTNFTSIQELLTELHLPKRLLVLLEGESLFSDTFAVLIFGFLISLGLQNQTHFSWGGEISLFIVKIIGGGLLGVIIGRLAVWMMTVIKEVTTQALVTLIVVYAGFILSESILHAAGFMTVFVTGITLNKYLKTTTKSFLNTLWEFISLLALTGLFILVGVTITTNMFLERYLAMLIGIVAIGIARHIAIFGVLSSLGSCAWIKPLSLREQEIVALSGVRGGIAIALAFAVPIELDYWWTVQSIAFGVVLFTLIIQAPICARILAASSAKG